MSQNFIISLEDAATLTANYRNQFSGGSSFIKGEMFDNLAIQSVLDQTGCVSMRIYYGLKTDDSPCLIIVGVDSNGDDLCDGKLLENGLTCPPVCSTNNSLNS